MSSHIFSCVLVLQPSWLRLEYFHHRNDTSRKQPLTIPPFGPSNHSPAFVFAVCGTCCISRISRVPTSRLIFLEFPWCFLAPLWSCSVSFHHHHSWSRTREGSQCTLSRCRAWLRLHLGPGCPTWEPLALTGLFAS